MPVKIDRGAGTAETDNGILEHLSDLVGIGSGTDDIVAARAERDEVGGEVECRLDLLRNDLRDQLAAQQREAEKPVPSFVPLDDLFHRTLCESVGHPNAWAVIESLKSQLDRVRQMATEQFPLSDLVAQHAAIVDAIEQHEPAAAESSLRLHLQRILSDLPKIRERYADLFEPT